MHRYLEQKLRLLFEDAGADVPVKVTAICFIIISFKSQLWNVIFFVCIVLSLQPHIITIRSYYFPSLFFYNTVFITRIPALKFPVTR